MTQASWNGSASTIPAFINNLFSSDVRSASVVQNAVGLAEVTYSFADNATRSLILNAWLAAWQNANGDPYDAAALAMCPANDQTLISYLSGYIKKNDLSMSAPQLTYAGMSPPDPKTKQQYGTYTNNGYVTQGFLFNGAWNYGQINSAGQPVSSASSPGTVAQFLSALYYGAHFVVVSNAQDLGVQTGPPQFWQRFAKSNLSISGDKFNSHYSGVNLTGYYYLDVWTTVPECLLLAFLAGLTNPAEAEYTAGAVTAVASSGAIVVPVPALEAAGAVGIAASTAIIGHAQSRRAQANTFIQLEGWQNHFPWVGGWHSADYDAHTATLWNFSTFGACAYSEKRSTPIFLAGSGFSKALNASTHMPLYNGASGLESWMNPSLLKLPSS